MSAAQSIASCGESERLKARDRAPVERDTGCAHAERVCLASSVPKAVLARSSLSSQSPSTVMPVVVLVAARVTVSAPVKVEILPPLTLPLMVTLSLGVEAYRHWDTSEATLVERIAPTLTVMLAPRLSL